jgi:8-oxo-dGTP pyrophosphatase MutT (NUDIX family)
MSKLRYFSDAADRVPGLTPDWTPGGRDVVLSNPEYGMIVHVLVCQDDDRPLYDLPAWAEPRGAIIVPVTADGRLVLVENLRPVLAASRRADRYPPGELSERGRTSLEFPRGFAKSGEPSETTARREAEEETGLAVESVRLLGECNANTSFQMNNIPVFVARMLDRPGTEAPDSTEVIRAVRIVTLSEVVDLCRSGEIVCALTKAALLHYLVSEANAIGRRV